MRTALSVSWGSLLFRGIIAVLFGIFLWVDPGLTLATLIMIFAAFVFVTGLFMTIFAIKDRHQNEDWALQLIEGLIGIIAGILIWTWPGISAMLLVYIIAAWALISGIVQIIAAIKLRKQVRNEFWLVLSGIVSVIFGLIIFRFPGAGALAIAWIIGIYAVVFGIISIILAFRVRKVQKSQSLNA